MKVIIFFLIQQLRGCEGNRPHRTVRCLACLILFKLYKPDLPF